MYFSLCNFISIVCNDQIFLTSIILCKYFIISPSTVVLDCKLNLRQMQGHYPKFFFYFLFIQYILFQNILYSKTLQHQQRDMNLLGDQSAYHSHGVCVNVIGWLCGITCKQRLACSAPASSFTLYAGWNLLAIQYITHYPIKR